MAGTPADALAGSRPKAVVTCRTTAALLVAPRRFRKSRRVTTLDTLPPSDSVVTIVFFLFANPCDRPDVAREACHRAAPNLALDPLPVFLKTF
jgi:hypothetical protein